MTVLVCRFASQDIQRGSSLFLPLSPSLALFLLTSRHSIALMGCHVSLTLEVFSLGAPVRRKWGTAVCCYRQGIRSNGQMRQTCVCEGKEMSARWQMKKERWEVKAFKTAKELQSVWTQFCWWFWLDLTRPRTHTHFAIWMGTFHRPAVFKLYSRDLQGAAREY